MTGPGHPAFTMRHPLRRGPPRRRPSSMENFRPRKAMSGMGLQSPLVNMIRPEIFSIFHR